MRLTRRSQRTGVAGGMRPYVGLVVCLLLHWLAVAPAAAHPADASSPVGQGVAWSVDRDYRLLVRVDPVDLTGRDNDTLVAIRHLDFTAYLGGDRVDPSSLVVVGYSPQSGEPLTDRSLAEPETLGEVTSRFYDDAVPWAFPDYIDYVNHETGGLGNFKTITAGGRLYGTVGDARSGRVAWEHLQRGEKTSYYAIYFDRLDEGEPVAHARAGFIGDGGQRCEATSPEFAPVLHGRVAVADFNADGLFDLVLGNAAGTLLYYENHGREGEPRFPAGRLLMSDESTPIDVGWSSAPKAVDWDGDGDTDLIVGAEKEALLLFRNIGDAEQMRFKREGLLQADGHSLRTPRQPCKEDPTNSIYPLDYYPVPEVVDWDGDGDLDVLAGGYITGTIFLYENTADSSNAEPELTYRGTLKDEAGADLDVTWCAAPTVADFDGDGDLDLISGAMQMTEGGGDKIDHTKFLWYYENVGTRENPVLVHREFPAEGRFVFGALGTPRSIDFNNDGLLDLVVSTGGYLTMHANIGSASQPRFDADAQPVRSQWGRVSLGHNQMIDINRDGWPDLFNGTSILLNAGEGAPGVFDTKVELPGIEQVSHPVDSGDGWDYRVLCDLDGDGDVDVLSGDHAGRVWLHRNAGSNEQARIDPEGELLHLVSGEPIRVGIPPQGASEFDIHQGARTALSGLQYNDDGLMDLLVCDTYGYLRLFIQRDGEGLRFDEPIEVARLHEIRVVPNTSDWDGDGRDDVLVSYASGQVYALINRSGTASGEPFQIQGPLDLPPGIGEPKVTVGDWNHDGDDDVIIQDYYYMRFAERSFIDHGYRQAEALTFQARD